MLIDDSTIKVEKVQISNPESTTFRYENYEKVLFGKGYLRTTIAIIQF